MSQFPSEPLGFVINDVARMLRWQFDRRATEIGLTRSQWYVLAHLLRKDGMQQKELAEQMEITAISLTGLLDRLERDGWVERRSDPGDRRAKRIFLTPKVEPVLKAIQKLGRELRNESLQGFSESEQEQLMTLLLRMRSNLSQR